jgi:hypothetical protein
MMEIAGQLCMVPASAKTALNAAHNQRPRMERPLSGGFSVGKGAEEMPRKLRQELPESEILRERALRCRQLADGAGNLEFAIKLNAISNEYECDAKRTDVGGHINRRYYSSHQKE